MQMKKIGILTFCRSYNYGAFLQCYSLSKRLQSDFPAYKVEVIDYNTQSTVKNYRLELLNWKRNLKNPGSLIHLARRNRVFRDNISILPLSDYHIVSDDYRVLFDRIGKEYDAIVVGSDAVWNWELRGFPNAYFLNFESKARFFSYAASVYGMDYGNMTENMKTYLKGAFDRYAFIGTRDEPTSGLVNTCGSSVLPVHTCDPTAFLDLDCLPVDREKLKQKMQKKGVDFSKPLIGVMAGPHLNKAIFDRYRGKVQFIGLYVPNPNVDVFLDNLTPFEWAVVFSFFKLTLTHFFHGTMLSLKNNTPLVIVEKQNPYSRKYCSKIFDVLTRLGLTDFYHTTDTPLEKVFGDMDALLQKSEYDIEGAMRAEAMTYTVFYESMKRELGAGNAEVFG